MDLAAAHRDVLVLVGTQTGNTERVADAVADRLAELGFTCHVVDMSDAYPEQIADYRQLVVALCTWADGTYPDNALDFASALDAVTPALDGVAFGVVGLGDRAYEPFYQTAAERMRNSLGSLGARELVPILEVDGAPTPAHLSRARMWATGLAEAFAAVG
jgi:sulfite reductase alpha subunit-like flavoprotein